ncbi:MAG: hypothetical protein CMO81_10610 [Waddliaceae bacterium]|nr:hypothetical protein [Waddliaceae bacterium]
MTFSAVRTLLLFLALLITESCNSKKTTKNTSDKPLSIFRANLKDGAVSIDPRRGRTIHALTVSRLLFEGLTRTNTNGKAEAGIAESWTVSEDGLKYIFKLRKSVWSDGAACTANDFVYAWRQALEPNFPSDFSSLLYCIKGAESAKKGLISTNSIGVKAKDYRTLCVTLESPTPYFLELLTLPIYAPIPKHYASKYPKWHEKSHYIPPHNGPFTVKRWAEADEIHLIKNSAYWEQNNVFLNEIQFIFVDEHTELAMFQNNELDWAGSPLSVLPVDSLNHLKNNNSLAISPALHTEFIRVNTLDPTLSNPKIRRALSLALNRQQLVDHLLQGGQTPATGLVPLSLKKEKPSFFHDADIDEARKLFNEALEELSLSSDSFPSLTLTFGQDARRRRLAQSMQEQWKEVLGIHIELRTVESKVLFSELRQGNTQLCMGSWVADFPDSSNFLEVFKYKDSSTNNTGWQSQAYVELLEQANYCSTNEEREKLLNNAEALLIQDMPIIPIYFGSFVSLKKPQSAYVQVSSIGLLDFSWKPSIKNVQIL